jgi:hypothetical protein
MKSGKETSDDVLDSALGDSSGDDDADAGLVMGMEAVKFGVIRE